MRAMTGPSGGWASPSGEGSAAHPSPPPVAPPPPGWQPTAGWSGQAGWGGQTNWGTLGPPEAKPGVIPLRPLGLGELLDGAVTLVRRYPRPALGLSAAIAIISTTLNIVLAVTALRPLVSFDAGVLSRGNGAAATSQLDGALGGAALGGVGSGLVNALATLVLTGILTAIVGRGVLGLPMTLAQAWAEVRPVLPRLIGVAILTALLVYGTLAAGLIVAALSLAAFGAPGALLAIPAAVAGAAGAAYLYCRLALAPCAAVLEKAGIRASLRRSGILVRRSWWRVFGILLLTLLVAGFVTQVAQLPFLLVGLGPGGFGPGGFGRGGNLTGSTTRLLVLSYLGAGIGQTLVAPFTAGVRALLYVDRRMRAEGLDVTLAAAAGQPS